MSGTREKESSLLACFKWTFFVICSLNNSTMKIKLVIGVALFVLVIVGVYFFIFKEKGQITGGPCSYTTIQFPATIVDIAAIGDNESDIKFTVEGYGNTDTLSFYVANNKAVSNQIIFEKGFKVGDVLVFECDEILTGTCNPSICGFKLEKYIKP